MSDKEFLRIGELAKRANTTTKALRYYERIGLLTPAARGENRYRLYAPEALGQVRFIRRAKRMGLTLDEVASLVAIAKQGASESLREQLDQILARKIRETDNQIKSLTRFREDLKLLRAQLVRAGIEQCQTCGAVMANCDCSKRASPNRGT
jgi:MerR family Zn(II)-responsive transcriptional regulator of zntA